MARETRNGTKPKGGKKYQGLPAKEKQDVQTTTTGKGTKICPNWTHTLSNFNDKNPARWFADAKNHNWEPYKGKNADHTNVYPPLNAQASQVTGLCIRTEFNPIWRQTVLIADRDNKGTKLIGKQRAACAKRIALLIWKACKVDWKNDPNFKRYLRGVTRVLIGYHIRLIKRNKNLTIEEDEELDTISDAEGWEESENEYDDDKGDDEDDNANSKLSSTNTPQPHRFLAPATPQNTNGNRSDSTFTASSGKRERPSTAVSQSSPFTSPSLTAKSASSKKRKLGNASTYNQDQKPIDLTLNPQPMNTICLRIYFKAGEYLDISTECLVVPQMRSAPQAELFSYHLDYKGIWDVLRESVENFKLMKETSKLFWMENGELSPPVRNNIQWQTGFDERCVRKGRVCVEDRIQMRITELEADETA